VDDTEILYHVDGKILASTQLLATQMAAQKSYGQMYRYTAGMKEFSAQTDTARKSVLGNVVACGTASCRLGRFQVAVRR
jgi:hypothetical protein